MCHDLLRRSPRLTICSPLFFKSSKFHFHYHTTTTTNFFTFNFFTNQFLVFTFSFFTNHFYVQLFYEQFLRSHFSVQSYRTQGPAADTILTFLRPLDLPLRCSLATRTRSIPWFSPPFTPEMLLCRQSQCDSACGLGSSLRLLYRHVPSS